jgi:hypothetical protein
MVFIYNSSANLLWLISHNEIKEDLQNKYNVDPMAQKRSLLAFIEYVKVKIPIMESIKSTTSP